MATRSEVAEQLLEQQQEMFIYLLDTYINMIDKKVEQFMSEMRGEMRRLALSVAYTRFHNFSV